MNIAQSMNVKVKQLGQSMTGLIIVTALLSSAGSWFVNTVFDSPSSIQETKTETTIAISSAKEEINRDISFTNQKVSALEISVQNINKSIDRIIDKQDETAAIYNSQIIPLLNTVKEKLK